MSKAKKIILNGTSIDLGGGSGELSSDLTANQNIGGVKSGDKWDAGTSLESVVRSIVYAYVKPTCTITSGGNYEIGTTNNVTITIKVTDSENSHVTNVWLYKGSTIVMKNTNGAGTITYNGTVSENTTWTVQVYEGSNMVASAKTSSNFYNYYYYGTSESVPTSVTGTSAFMTGNSVDLKSELTWDNKCFYVMIPTTTTGSSSVVTQNNESIKMSSKTLTKDGVTYKVFYAVSETVPNVEFNKLTVSK